MGRAIAVESSSDDMVGEWGKEWGKEKSPESRVGSPGLS